MRNSEFGVRNANTGLSVSQNDGLRSIRPILPGGTRRWVGLRPVSNRRVEKKVSFVTARSIKRGEESLAQTRPFWLVFELFKLIELFEFRGLEVRDIRIDRFR